MKILLIGEYSNVHNTLAEALKSLGHTVVTASDGDFWKNYSRDISMVRYPGFFSKFVYFFRLLYLFIFKFRNFDVVQLISSHFLNLKANKHYFFYKLLRRFNKKFFLGAFGNDFYWVDACLNSDLYRYSDLKFFGKKRFYPSGEALIKEYFYGPDSALNMYIANDCNFIISCLWEYHAAYQRYFRNKEIFIPLPVNVEQIIPASKNVFCGKMNFFIGIQKSRNEYKGTDLLYSALKKLYSDYPDKVEILKAEDVPFETYQNMMNNADVLLDQAWSYTPAMNGLLAMAKGIVLVGGGEKENYQILGENVLRPVVNVLPDEDDIYQKLKFLLFHKDYVQKLKIQSVEYINKYHDYINVAKQYLKIYSSY